MERPGSPRVNQLGSRPTTPLPAGSQPSSPRRTLSVVSRLAQTASKPAASASQSEQQPSLVQQHLQRFHETLKDVEHPKVFGGRHRFARRQKSSVDIGPQLRAMDHIAQQRMSVDLSSMRGPRTDWRDSRPHAPPRVEGEYSAKFDLTLKRSRSSIGASTTPGGGGSAAARIARLVRMGSHDLAFNSMHHGHGHGGVAGPGGADDELGGGVSRRLQASITSALWTDIAELRGSRRLRQYLEVRKRRPGEPPMKLLIDEAEEWELMRRQQQQQRLPETIGVSSGGGCGGSSGAHALQSGGSGTTLHGTPHDLPGPSLPPPPPPPPVVFVAETDWAAAAAAAGVKTPERGGPSLSLPPVAAQSLGQNTKIHEGLAKPAPTSVVLVHFPAQVDPSSAAAASAGKPGAGGGRSSTAGASISVAMAAAPVRGPRRALSLQPAPSAAIACSPPLLPRSISVGVAGPAAGLSVRGSDSVAAAAAAAGFVPGVERYHTGFTLPSAALSTVADRLSPRSLVIASQMVEVVEVLQPPRLRQRSRQPHRPSESRSSDPSGGGPAQPAAVAAPLRRTSLQRSATTTKVRDATDLLEALPERKPSRSGTWGPAMSAAVAAAPVLPEVATADAAGLRGEGGSEQSHRRHSIADPTGNWADAVQSMRWTVSRGADSGGPGGGPFSPFAVKFASSSRREQPSPERRVPSSLPPPAVLAWAGSGRSTLAPVAASIATPSTSSASTADEDDDGDRDTPPQLLPQRRKAAARRGPPEGVGGGSGDLPVGSFAAAAKAVMQAQQWRRKMASPGAGTQVDDKAFRTVAAAEADADPTRPLGLVPALATSGSQIIVRAQAVGTAAAAAADTAAEPLGPMATKRIRSKAVTQLQKVWSLGARDAAAAAAAAARVNGGLTSLASFASSRRTSYSGTSGRTGGGAAPSPLVGSSSPSVASVGASEAADVTDRTAGRVGAGMAVAQEGRPWGDVALAGQDPAQGVSSPHSMAGGGTADSLGRGSLMSEASAPPANLLIPSRLVMDVIPEADLEDEEPAPSPNSGVDQHGSSRKAVRTQRRVTLLAADPTAVLTYDARAAEDDSDGSAAAAEEAAAKPAQSATLRLDMPRTRTLVLRTRGHVLRTRNLRNILLPSRSLTRGPSQAGIRGGAGGSVDADYGADGSGGESAAVAPSVTFADTVGRGGSDSGGSSSGDSGNAHRKGDRDGRVASEATKGSSSTTTGDGSSLHASLLRRLIGNRREESHSGSSGGSDGGSGGSPVRAGGIHVRPHKGDSRRHQSMKRLFTDQLRLASLVYDTAEADVDGEKSLPDAEDVGAQQEAERQQEAAEGPVALGPGAAAAVAVPGAAAAVAVPALEVRDGWGGDEGGEEAHRRRRPVHHRNHHHHHHHPQPVKSFDADGPVRTHQQGHQQQQHNHHGHHIQQHQHQHQIQQPRTPQARDKLDPSHHHRSSSNSQAVHKEDHHDYHHQKTSRHQQQQQQHRHCSHESKGAAAPPPAPATNEARTATVAGLTEAATAAVRRPSSSGGAVYGAATAAVPGGLDSGVAASPRQQSSSVSAAAATLVVGHNTGDMESSVDGSSHPLYGSNDDAASATAASGGMGGEVAGATAVEGNRRHVGWGNADGEGEGRPKQRPVHSPEPGRRPSRLNRSSSVMVY